MNPYPITAWQSMHSDTTDELAFKNAASFVFRRFGEHVRSPLE